MEDGTCQKCQGLQCHWPLRMGLGHHEKGWKVEWRDRPGRLAVSLSGVYSKLGICLCLVRRKYWSCILLGSMVKICEDSKRFFRFKWQWFADGIRWPCWYTIFWGSFLKANGKLMFNLVVYLKFTVHSPYEKKFMFAETPWPFWSLTIVRHNIDKTIKEEWTPGGAVFTLPPIIMEVEKGPSNMSFLSFRVVFHFHDYGRKDKL